MLTGLFNLAQRALFNARTMRTLVLCSTVVAASGCSSFPTASRAAKGGALQSRVFGTLPDGTEVQVYTLTNRRGMNAKVSEYGATLTELWVPDRSGSLTNVVLGFDRLEGYLNGPPFVGATVGRVANRIAEGRFILDGKEYTLVTNRPPNHLHGGTRGFDKRVWKSRALPSSPGASGVEFSYNSPD